MENEETVFLGNETMNQIELNLSCTQMIIRRFLTLNKIELYLYMKDGSGWSLKIEPYLYMKDGSGWSLKIEPYLYMKDGSGWSLKNCFSFLLKIQDDRHC